MRKRPHGPTDPWPQVAAGRQKRPDHCLWGQEKGQGLRGLKTGRPAPGVHGPCLRSSPPATAPAPLVALPCLVLPCCGLGTCVARLEPVRATASPVTTPREPKRDSGPAGRIRPPREGPGHRLRSRLGSTRATRGCFAPPSQTRLLRIAAGDFQLLRKVKLTLNKCGVTWGGRRQLNAVATIHSGQCVTGLSHRCFDAVVRIGLRPRTPHRPRGNELHDPASP